MTGFSKRGRCVHGEILSQTNLLKVKILKDPAAQCSGWNIQSRSLSVDSQSPITLGHNYLARLDNFIMITCVIWSGSFQTGILQNWFTETDG